MGIALPSNCAAAHLDRNAGPAFSAADLASGKGLWLKTMEQDLAIAQTPFWYLRHGETDWNRQGLSQGSNDIPLNELGLAQAREAAVRLRNRGITSIVASPLSRARVTAEIVGEALGLEVTIEPDLREVSWGVREGEPLADWFHGWIAGHTTPEGAESFSELRRRSVAGLNRAVGQPPLCWWSRMAACSAPSAP